jgi:hypothetical protein
VANTDFDLLGLLFRSVAKLFFRTGLAPPPFFHPLPRDRVA